MDLSVVIPIYNERDNVASLCDEIATALGDKHYEIICVDDGSHDGTNELLTQLTADIAALRVVTHQSCVGQSYALVSGIEVARSDVIATLDGDGQNNPADMIKLLACYHTQRYDLVMGWRVQRQDNWLKKVSSKIANAIRRFLLSDNSPDSGCGIKVFNRRLFLSLPKFDHMHRYLPALFQGAGGSVTSIEVSHRSRKKGTSKYGLHNRLWVGIVDLLMVCWLKKRTKKPIIKRR